MTGISIPVHAAETAITLEPSRHADTKIDPLNLFIDKKGNLISEGDLFSFAKLSEWIRRAQEHGEKPAVALILCPKLRSNSDLPKIKKILDFLVAQGALYEVTIQPQDWIP